MASELKETCGCVSKDWYGCLRCGKEECDEETHSAKYEHQAIIDNSGCRFAALHAELQAAREENKRLDATRDQYEDDCEQLHQRLRTAQAEIERLKSRQFPEGYDAVDLDESEKSIELLEAENSKIHRQWQVDIDLVLNYKQQLATAKAEIERLKASPEQRSPAES